MSGNDLGLLILDPTHAPIASSSEALRILTFPLTPSQMPHAETFVRHRVGSELLLSANHHPDALFVSEFRSGKRKYFCTSFSLQGTKTVAGEPWVALLFERSTRSTVDLALVAAQYALTPRERELVQNLLLGLTTKEIAGRMKVSASTVNAFLHLVMVKMGARTRSGVVRKIVCPER